MFSSQYILAIAVIGAILFLAVQGKKFFSLRPLIKMIMGVALAIYCFSAGNTLLSIMGAGFIASSLGDFFLDLPEDNYFIPGLVSFFGAHVAFLIVLWSFASWSLPICATIALITIGFFFWLKPALDKELVAPVAAYSVIIGLMCAAALTTNLSSLLVPLGALSFLASDIVLAIEKFKTKFPMDKTINWILYASGQIALAIGVVSSLSL
ncbi:MAG: lysoplasmalogenase [Acidimicrobiales bacterium]|nr:MAG: lysoplasmalogenase [Acidimicrobiales bacterium]